MYAPPPRPASSLHRCPDLLSHTREGRQTLITTRPFWWPCTCRGREGQQPASAASSTFRTTALIHSCCSRQPRPRPRRRAGCRHALVQCNEGNERTRLAPTNFINDLFTSELLTVRPSCCLFCLPVASAQHSPLPTSTPRQRPPPPATTAAARRSPLTLDTTYFPKQRLLLLDHLDSTPPPQCQPTTSSLRTTAPRARSAPKRGAGSTRLRVVPGMGIGMTMGSGYVRRGGRKPAATRPRSLTR